MESQDLICDNHKTQSMHQLIIGFFHSFIYSCQHSIPIYQSNTHLLNTYESRQSVEHTDFHHIIETTLNQDIRRI